MWVEFVEVLRTERLTLVEPLESLDDAQWRTHSLCSGWTVPDLAAHLAWAASPPPLDAATGAALLAARR